MKSFVVFTALLLLFSCSDSKTATKPNENFVGEYKVIRYPYSNAKLVISSDHSFKYYETGHMSDYHSNGLWEKRGDTILLNSLTPNECLHIDDFTLTSHSSDEIRTTFKNCELGENKAGEFFTEFKNSRFIIKKDSLIYLDLNEDYKNKYGNYKIFKEL